MVHHYKPNNRKGYNKSGDFQLLLLQLSEQKRKSRSEPSRKRSTTLAEA